MLTVGVHFVGAIALIGLLLSSSDGDWRSWWPRDDDDRGPETPDAPAPRGPGGDNVPLPDAAPARVRRREPARLGEGYPRPARRPVHPPTPEREPAPEHTPS
jgi:hypothetical protein